MMTNKEFFTAIVNANLSDEITEKAQHLLDVNEKKNTKRSDERSKNTQANLELFEKIKAVLEVGTTYAVSEIKEKLADVEELNELSTSKISAVLKLAVEKELAEAMDKYKVGGKGRVVKGYTVI